MHLSRETMLKATRQQQSDLSPYRSSRPWLWIAHYPWLTGLVGLGCLVALLAVGLVWSYQTAPEFELDLGSKEARPFISGFHQPEIRRTDGLTYRWSTGNAQLQIVGFGRRDATLWLDLAAPGPDLAPPPTVTILAGGVELAQIATLPEVRRYSVPVPATLMPGGDVTIELKTTTFQPPRDNRRLGVLVDHARLEPAVGSPPAWPPWRLVGLMAIVAIMVMAVGSASLSQPLPALAAAGLVSLALLALSRIDRYTLALWVNEGTPLVVGSGLLALAGLGITRLVGGRVATATGLLWLILWTVALTHLLGVAHPHFSTSDLTFNVHRLEDVGRGRWLFTADLPGRSALPAPYPPAFYALLLPILPLVNHDAGLKELLITHSSALMMTTLAAIAFFVGRRIAGPTAGLWAALLHGLAPAGFLLVSQGNFANVFGQWAAGLVLLALVCWPDWRAPMALSTIVGLATLALLGHFGIFLTLLVAIPLLALAAMTLPPDGRRQGLVLLGLFAIALALAAGIYYRHYVGLVGEVAQRIITTRAAGETGLGWQAGPIDEWRRTSESLGLLGLPLAAGGLLGLWRSGTLAGRLVLGWLAAGATFAIVGITLGLSVRYQFFALLGLAVAAGWTLAWLGGRGWIGRLLTLLLAAGWITGGLAFWWLRIFWYTRLPL